MIIYKFDLIVWIKNFSFLLSVKTWFEPIVFPGSLAVLASQSEANQLNLTFPRWCGQGESNSRLNLGKVVFCH